MHSCIRGKTDGERDGKHALFAMENMRWCLETLILARMKVVSFAVSSPSTKTSRPPYNIASAAMQHLETRTVLDDFDPYIDETERAELGEARVLVKDELYMPVHPSRDWIKCFVTSTQQDGFRYV
jgi:hypothetical protein